MTENTAPRKGIVYQIKRFFKETFRLHTGGEYSEFLTRGIKKNENALNGQYPWAYMRLFALLFILFAVFLLLMRFTQNELFAPTVTVLASVVFNLSFLVFLYELYPERNLSLIAVVAAMLIGGTCADVLTQVLYSLFNTSNQWLAAVYSGFFEELSKAAVTVIVIVIASKKSSLAGFLMGAAVGCGFSIAEDMGYIFVLSNELATNISTTIEIAISRGLSAFCTHMLWTGAVGWAYSYFNRHFSNASFYLLLILSCGLHICWDLPLTGVWYALNITLCVVVAAAESILIFYFMRKKVAASFLAESAGGGEAVGVPSSAEEQADDRIVEANSAVNAESSSETGGVNRAERTAHGGHLCLAVGAFLMAVIAVIYCSIPFRESYYTQKFESAESFAAFMQEDLDLHVVTDRQFDTSLSDEYNKLTVVDGVLDKVTQEVTEEGFKYFYSYNVVQSEGEYYYYFTDVSVEIVINGVHSTYAAESIYNNGRLFVSFFRVRGDVTGYNFDSEGNITAFIYDAAFVRDLSQPQYTVLFYTFAGIAGLAVCGYISCKIKTRRIKKNAER